jgi:hypothetical protein
MGAKRWQCEGNERELRARRRQCEGGEGTKRKRGQSEGNGRAVMAKVESRERGSEGKGTAMRSWEREAKEGNEDSWGKEGAMRG